MDARYLDQPKTLNVPEITNLHSETLWSEISQDTDGFTYNQVLGLRILTAFLNPNYKSPKTIL